MAYTATIWEDTTSLTLCFTDLLTDLISMEEAQRRGEKDDAELIELMQKPNFKVIQVLYRDKICCLYYWSREISPRLHE